MPVCRIFNSLVPATVVLDAHTSCIVQVSVTAAAPEYELPDSSSRGEDCAVPDTAAVVFAHSQEIAEVWLNVDVKPAIASVKLALGFPIADHTTDDALAPVW